MPFDNFLRWNSPNTEDVCWHLFSQVQKEENLVLLRSNQFENKIIENQFDWLLAFGAKNKYIAQNESDFENLQSFIDDEKEWLFGHFNYDAKNQLENLESNNPKRIPFPEMHFFSAKHIVIAIKNQLYVKSSAPEYLQSLLDNKIKNSSSDKHCTFNLKPTISKNEFLEKIESLKKHIQLGDIYEVNFCQEFIDSPKSFYPELAFKLMQEKTPSPFSAFYKIGDFYALSSSPERYICKRGSKVSSQPIKGTIKRSADKETDFDLRKKLELSEKDKAENVMIVDLVRNDLARIAKKGSVVVDELFGLYTFPHVHQLISTVSCEVYENTANIDIIKKTFPMGSMTGAPKIRAMQLIEKHENFQRGLYSGAIGYFNPNGDFDFNVVIRTLLYDTGQNKLQLAVGGAITAQSVSEDEYEETLLKAHSVNIALQD